MKYSGSRLVSLQCFQPQQVFHNSVNVMTFGMVKSDHIKRLLVFLNAKFVTIELLPLLMLRSWDYERIFFISFDCQVAKEYEEINGLNLSSY